MAGHITGHHMHVALVAMVLGAALLLGVTVADSQSKPYEVSMADAMIDFSAAAYCPADRLEAWNCITCKDQPGVTAQVIYYSPTDTQAFVAWDATRSAIWVVFRGTDPLSIKDWIDDLNFFKTAKTEWKNCSDCHVHEGFYDAYMNVADDIRAAVRVLQAEHPSAPLFVSGHSLGAALAELGALDLREELDYVPKAVYTFGTPRVGDDNWRLYYGTQIPNNYRITHNADPVPHLPPELFGFHHTATEVWYNELETHYHVCDGSGEDKAGADGVIFPLLITDHLTYMGLNFSANFINCKL